MKMMPDFFSSRKGGFFMRKILLSVLILTFLFSFGLSCGQKSAKKPVPAKIKTGKAEKPGQISPDLAKYNRWAASLRAELEKRGGGKINNIALPGKKLGARIAIFTCDFSRQGQKNLAYYVAKNYKKNFPKKPTMIEIYDDGRLVFTYPVYQPEQVKK